MMKNPMTPFRSVVMVAALLILGACGDDAASEQLATGGDDTTTSGAAEPSAETTSTAATAEQTEADAEAWANEVVAAYDELSADQVDNAVRWSEIATGDPDVPVVVAEVDAYLFLTTANSETVTAAVEQMPAPPDDPTLAAPYGALLDALRAEAEGADALAAELEADNDTLEQEITDRLDSPDGVGRFDEIRLAFRQLQDATSSACFALQAAMTERGLALVDCTGE